MKDSICSIIELRAQVKCCYYFFTVGIITMLLQVSSSIIVCCSFDVVQVFDYWVNVYLSSGKRSIICVAAVAREKIFRRQTTFVQYHTSAPMAKNRILIWVVRFLPPFSRKYDETIKYWMGGMFFTSLQTCFFRQFGRSVDRSDYLTLRKGFIVVGDTLCRMNVCFFHSNFYEWQ